MVRVVGEKGYRATSVADVLTAANVARATFYKHFQDKHDCFLEAYDLSAEQVIGQVTSGCDGQLPWLERMESGLAALVDVFAQDPALARMVMVEAAMAGSDARRRQLQAIAKFAELMEEGREAVSDRTLPANTSTMAASAVSGLIFDELLGGRAEQLPRLMPDLLFAMLVPYVGPQAAAEEMRRVGVASAG